RSETEQHLQRALEESEARNRQQKSRIRGLQASAILSNLYVARAHTQLQAQEDKTSRKKSTHILSDGLPRLLTNDEMFALVCQHEEASEQR
ncbi:hypothetical protein FOMPIDRAFT_16437, partial [Fomitopsis schrenkii]